MERKRSKDLGEYLDESKMNRRSLTTEDSERTIHISEVVRRESTLSSGGKINR